MVSVPISIAHRSLLLVDLHIFDRWKRAVSVLFCIQFSYHRIFPVILCHYVPQPTVFEMSSQRGVDKECFLTERKTSEVNTGLYENIEIIDCKGNHGQPTVNRFADELASSATSSIPLSIM